jgi:hypothetical protein
MQQIDRSTLSNLTLVFDSLGAEDLNLILGRQFVSSDVKNHTSI